MDSVFEGTVSDSVGKGVPADATGFCDLQVLILTRIDPL
jgi:hypothetical protein